MAQFTMEPQNGSLGEESKDISQKLKIRSHFFRISTKVAKEMIDLYNSSTSPKAHI